jgi:formate hydrogenlyase transcriptional activator
MVELNYIIALLTAGISLAMGTISFYLGWKQREKANLIFGLMALSLAIFIMLPPVGFISNHQPPHPIEVIVKRIFSYGYYALFPWFIFEYTNQRKKIIPLIISLYVFACYWIMVFASPGVPTPILMIPPLVAFAFILAYGIVSGIRQYQNQNKKKAQWFLVAISFFGILFIFTTINLLEIKPLIDFVGPQYIVSIHMHALIFVWVIGTQVIDEVITKHRLEKALNDRDKRWQSFMQFAPMIVLELDERGNIIFINDFGVKLLGYQSSKELNQLNWCDNFLSEPDAKMCKAQFAQTIESRKSMPFHKTTLRNRNGDEHIVNWVSFLTFTEESNKYSMMSVGTDITQAETANKLINQLKLELEKERIVFPEHESEKFAEEIIGRSDAISYALDKSKQVAKTNAPVLLEGETGVGKELFADLIHKISLRSHAPIIKVNCGALPKELIEDELFGHEKGAFTSAIQARKGRFELADGGTIFLDEIGELPLEMQPKLLRVLQNGEFERIGGQKTIKVDVRIIAATNRELQHEVQEGRFRDDLFYRLNVFPITIPALRKRKEDLPLLINHFISLEAKKYNKQLEQISKADMQRLSEYSWPGNVRELKNVIERSVIASEGNTLRLDWFLEETNYAASGTTLEDIERQHIIKMLDACHWKINGDNGAAEKLNMHPNTLRSKMKRLGINRPVNDIS